MRQCLLDEIKNTIYNFYPKDIAFDDLSYHKSKQHKNLLEKRKNALLNIDFKNYLKSNLENIFAHYAVNDFVDLENDTSYCYRILMHKNQPILDDDIVLIKTLGGLKYELIFVLSYLDRYCYYYISETRFDFNSDKWSFRSKFDDNNFVKIENNFLSLGEFKKLERFLSGNNYCFVSDNLIDFVIGDIETELCNFKETKIYSALFSDLISI